MQKLHIIIFLSLIWSFSFSQQYTNYNSKNGLPGNHVYRITQDAQGFIWFITDKGMTKYNGTTFKTFTVRNGLPVNDIWNIIATPDNKIWYFSKSPKLGYIENDIVYAFPSEIQGEILAPMHRNIVGNIVTFNNSETSYQLKNKQWKKQNCLGHLSKQKLFKTFLIHHKLDRFQFSKDQKNILFYTKNNKIDKKIKFIDAIKKAHTRSQINDSIYIWLTNKEYTIINLNNYQIKTTSFKDAININKSKYTRVHKVNNQIQITGEGFVSVMDRNYNLTNTHYIPIELKSHFSFIDKQNNIWIATFTNGVYKLPASKQLAVYSLTNEKIGKIRKIEDKIITTVLDKGFYSYDSISKKFKPFIQTKNYCYGAFHIPELNISFYITNKEIIRIKNNKITTEKTFKNTNFLNEKARQLIYHKNFLYSNYTSGLNRINPKNLKIVKTFTLNGIRTFISFKGKLIIATSNGLKILENDQIINLNLKTKTPNNFHKKPILSLSKIDKNTLLIGTDSYGAYLTDLTTTIPLKETEFLGINDGFAKNKKLWIATDNGIFLYKKDANFKYQFINKYTLNDGLLLKNAKSVYKTENNLIISSNKGITTIPKNKKPKNQFLDIYFQYIRYNNQKIKTKNPYTKNNQLHVNVGIIDFSENNKYNYKYRLLPIQKKWLKTTSSNFVFNDLKPNEYTLSIKSHKEIKNKKITITPLWYQTFWFKLFSRSFIFIFLISAFLFYIKKENQKNNVKLQTQKKLAEYELHALRSQMNPHFVFNSLNAIQYYITKNDIDLSEKYLVKFSRLIRMFFDFSREKEIPLRDEIKLLHSYLEIEKMRFGEDFLFQIHVLNPQLLDSFKIPTMLLQPIVENAVNHGLFHNNGKGLIEIYFKLQPNNKLIVTITDDGVGIKKSKEIQKKSIHIKKDTSSNVIKERLFLLNQSKKWKVTYTLKENKIGTSVIITFIKNE